VVILDLPITFSMGAMLRGATFPFQWNRKHPARIGLLPRQGDAADIAWFEIEPCFAFHAANAFDQPDGSVVLDLVTYPRMFDRSINGPEPQPSRFERFVLGPGGVQRQTLSDFRQEFPRCDERRIGRPYRYAYTVGLDVPRPGPEPLYRLDLHTGAILRHDFGAHHLPGETVFVPRHPDGAEDDGWLLTFVYDLAANSSTLTVLDAAQLGREPVALIHLPVRVPLGFHGNWIGDSADRGC
jgi:carotenoid cleavage dioxygenase